MQQEQLYQQRVREEQQQALCQQQLYQQRIREEQQLALQQQQQQDQRQHQEQLQALQEHEEEYEHQEQLATQHIQQLSQALSEALGEYSQHSGEQYEQDQARQRYVSTHNNIYHMFFLTYSRHSNPIFDDPNPSAGPSSAGSSRHSSPTPPSSPDPNPDPDGSSSSSDSSSNSSDSDQSNNPLPIHVPPDGRPYVEPVQSHSLGPMNIQCSHCHALHFISEKLSNSTIRNPCFGICCLQGQVTLPYIQQWPHNLQILFDDPQDHTQFKRKIREYNNALAFTSVGVDIDRLAVQGAGPASFHIHGPLHHLMGALLPPNELQPSYAQLYIYDPQEATNRHVQHNPQLNPGILLDLHTTLRDVHPYAPLYRQAYEIMQVSSSILLTNLQSNCLYHIGKTT